MFVPRSIVRKQGQTSLPRRQDTSKNVSAPPPVNSSVPNPVVARSEKDPKAAKELATLVELSLTDYALWKTPEVRVSMETQGQGWISFAALQRHSPLLQKLKESEHDAIWSLRNFGRGDLEVELALSTPSAPSRSLYHVRRKDWATLGELNIRAMTDGHWDDRTLYVENIPPQYWRTLGDLTAFLETLFSSSEKSCRVQNVSFPPKEGSSAEDRWCRGFAFIVLSDAQTANCVTNDWSWTGALERLQDIDVSIIGRQEGDDKPEMNEAARTCGLRALPLGRWKQLQDEYLQYLESIRKPTHHSAYNPSFSNASLPQDIEVTQKVVPQKRSAPAYPSPSSEFAGGAEFPQGCLVFVQNVHPQTNKTTLRKLLGRAFESHGSDSGQDDAVDYVDFSKGLEDCYVRLSSPGHATLLSRYFADGTTFQNDPLDDVGFQSASRSSKAIKVEVVSGVQEAAYWAKVPDKIKQAALERMTSNAETRTKPRKQRR